MFRLNLYALPVLLVALIGIPSALAQETRGTILGRVTDASNAVIPGVAIEVTNLETGVQTSVSTNGQGNYTAPFLIPGTYRITSTKQGFKRFVQGPLSVRINDTLEVNISLATGELAETVNVTADAPLLETAESSLGQVVDARGLAELPLPHGNAYLLMRLSPGANFTGSAIRDQPYEPINNVNYAMAGSPAARAEITLDGSSNTYKDQGSRRIGPAYAPPQDAVAEVKVQTATFNAVSGFSEGGTLAVSLKSGTNNLHGALYWVKIDPNLVANTFFANRSGIPRADLPYNRWGTTQSGPVILPRLYDGRNRTFFMASFEKIDENWSSGSVYTVPTAAERMGDFSALLKAGSNYQIYDPSTRQPAAGGRFSVQPFPGNIVPANRISPIATKILSEYPQPNVAGTADGTNNQQQPNLVSIVNFYSYVFRVDHNISDRHRIFGRFNTYGRHSEGNTYTVFSKEALGGWFEYHSNGVAVDDVYTFSPTLIMNVRLSDARFIRGQDTFPESVGYDATQLGFPSYVRDMIDPSKRRFPTINIQGLTSLGNRETLWRPTHLRAAVMAFEKTKGSHSFKFGGEFRSYIEDQYDFLPASGMSLTFGTTYTQGPFDNSAASPLGQGIASLMLGIPTAGQVDIADTFAERSSAWAGYVQDDWKVGRRLTLNLGIRYELENPVTERYNRSVRGFDPNATVNIGSQAQANYAANPIPEVPASQFKVQGGLNFAGVNGQPSTLWSRDTNNFMPRIGFAYSLNPKTVLRGGYGIYFGAIGVWRTDVIQTGFTQSTLLVPSVDGGLTFSATLANPFPNGLQQPPRSSRGASTNLGQSISFFNPNPKAQRNQKWQFDIQRELPGHVLVEAGYVGSYGDQLETGVNSGSGALSYDLNALPIKYLSTSPVRDQNTINSLTANVPNPFYPLLPGTNLSAAVIPRSTLLKPYPQYTNVFTTDFTGQSWYDALEVRAEKRFSAGYTAMFGYAWSKFIEATQYRNPGDPLPEKVISSQDFPHHLTFSSIAELPFGRGRHYLSKMPAVPQAILGGWQVDAILTYQSGMALGFGNALLTGTAKDVPLPSDQQTIDHWFNTAAFNRNTSQQLANNLQTLSSRFSNVRGPIYTWWDMSAIKNVKLREKYTVEFRGEFLNAFNHPSFVEPTTAPTSAAFGTITSQKNNPRRIQLSLRLKY